MKKTSGNILTVEMCGSLISVFCLLLMDCIYAGVLSNWWYVVDFVFWVSMIAANRTVRNRKPVWIGALVFITILLIYFWKLPEYSYQGAIDVIRAENMTIGEMETERVWKYKGFTDGKTYLIVFQSEKPEAFWFNPYCGDYGTFDLASRLPFLFD